MSVSKWAYSPERCDGDACVGDCDLCQKAKTSPSNIWMKIGEHIGEIMNLLFEDTSEMTTEEAIDQLASMRCHAEDMRDAEDEKSVWAKDIQAICMAIDALKKLSYLTDRPCEACEFHKENGCCKWSCVFEEEEE